MLEGALLELCSSLASPPCMLQNSKGKKAAPHLAPASTQHSAMPAAAPPQPHEMQTAEFSSLIEARSDRSQPRPDVTANIQPHLLSSMHVQHASPVHPSAGQRSTCTVRTAETWFQRCCNGPLVVYKVELNVVWWLIMATAFLVRFWRIDFPCYVV